MRRALDLQADARVRLTDDAALDELRADLLRVSYRAGTFELAHGVTSSGYFEKYRFATRPALVRRLGRFLADLVPATTDRLAAPAIGAALLGTAVSLETGLPLAVVRVGDGPTPPDAPRIEGGVHAGERVTVIEDVVVTGSRAAAAVAGLRAAGAVVTTVVAVVDTMSGGDARLDEVTYRPLFTIRDLGLPDGVFRAPSASSEPDGADGVVTGTTAPGADTEERA